MFDKIIIKTALLLFLLFNQFAKANDIGNMAGISQAAGNAAQAAADQLAADAIKVSKNIAEATTALEEATTDKIGRASWRERV